MNIFDYALKTEQDGEAHYRELAEKSENVGIKKIFNLLADEEAKHYQTFLRMKNNQPVPAGDENIFSQVKNVFQQMQAEESYQDVEGDDQVEVYRKIRETERKSQEFYLQQAEELSDPTHKELCLQIADEEARHALIMDNLIDFISRPTVWMENAEWRHMDDY